ncbi:hypothetical protein [Campylobacter curvus]|uniref:hypothetical protein n=1 Tax=Campylobacter curvus TaxID=200 RepID=UPI0014704723|nr:hypothetical protein [Campylobacter curvus]
MNQMEIYIIIAVVAGVLLYLQIQKFTKRLDEEEAGFGAPRSQISALTLQNSSEKYQKFCDSIDAQLRELKQYALYDKALKNEDTQEKFLEELSNISKKLTFVQTMNANTKDSGKWESELMEILSRIERLIDENFKEPKETNDKIRESLKEEFTRL